MVRAAEHEKYRIATNHWRLLEATVVGLSTELKTTHYIEVSSSGKDTVL